MNRGQLNTIYRLLTDLRSETRDDPEMRHAIDVILTWILDRHPVQ